MFIVKSECKKLILGQYVVNIPSLNNALAYLKDKMNKNW